MTVKFIFWDDNTGYGTSAKNYIRGLEEAGIEVIKKGMIPPGKGGVEYQVSDSDRRSDYKVVILYTPAYYIAKLIEKGKINVGFSLWETTVLPRNWVQVLNQCDFVMVPSRFNLECYQSSGVYRPILVCPYWSEFEEHPTYSNIDWGLRRNIHDPYVFYSIGMWTNRKNNLQLIECFMDCFNAKEQVKLRIKTSPKDYTKPYNKWLRKLGYNHFGLVKTQPYIKKLVDQDSRVEIIDETLTTEQILNLHLEGDCYISLCRSEGWGLGAFDAAWTKHPVIITGFGGQQDFLDTRHAFMLKYKLIDIHEQVWTEYNPDGQQWAEPDVQEAVNAMRWVYDHKQDAIDKGEANYNYVKNTFNKSTVILILINHLHYFEQA